MSPEKIWKNVVDIATPLVKRKNYEDTGLMNPNEASAKSEIYTHGVIDYQNGINAYGYGEVATSDSAYGNTYTQRRT